MTIADSTGLLITIDMHAASPHEVTLVAQTLEARFLEVLPEKLIGDRAYDYDPLDEYLLEEYGVEMTVPHRSNRKKKRT